jgi:hypothetical protein
MLQLSADLRTVIDEDGAVLLHLTQGKIVRCNRTGATIVDLLSRQFDQEQITAEFGRIYEISPASADADVRVFLASLEEQGLLHREEEGKSQG